MALKLNPDSPKPEITKKLIDLGLEMGKLYTVHWSDCCPLEWELRNKKQVALSMQCTKIDLLIKSKILITNF